MQGQEIHDIPWLLRPLSDHPDLGQGRAPSGLLSEREQAVLARLKIPKRRRDWLLGRWTAKHLVASWLGSSQEHNLTLDRIEIATEENGAPYVVVDGRRLTISISISHCRGYGYCALIAEPGIDLGADIEWVEPRARGFSEGYFSAREQAFLETLPEEDRNLAITLIWSAKEAALKAFKLGLTVDTRKVEVSLDLGHRDGWRPIVYQLDPVLGETGLKGWWQPFQSFVMTMATRFSTG